MFEVYFYVCIVHMYIQRKYEVRGRSDGTWRSENPIDVGVPRDFYIVWDIALVSDFSMKYGPISGSIWYIMDRSCFLFELNLWGADMQRAYRVIFFTGTPLKS